MIEGHFAVVKKYDFTETEKMMKLFIYFIMLLKIVEIVFYVYLKIDVYMIKNKEILQKMKKLF